MCVADAIIDRTVGCCLLMLSQLGQGNDNIVIVCFGCPVINVLYVNLKFTTRLNILECLSLSNNIVVGCSVN